MEETYDDLCEIYFERCESLIKHANYKGYAPSAISKEDFKNFIEEINKEIELISLASAEECLEVVLIQNNHPQDGQIDISAIPASHEALKRLYGYKLRVERLYNNLYIK